MNTHIEAVIEAVSKRITEIMASNPELKDLMELRGRLQAFSLDGDCAAAQKPKVRQARPIKRRQKRAPRQVKPEPEAPAPAAAAAGDILGTLRSLEQPFTGEDFAAATGVKSTLAAQYLWRYAKKGWLTKVGYGRYERAAGFPGGPGATGKKKTNAAETVHLQPRRKANGNLIRDCIQEIINDTTAPFGTKFIMDELLRRHPEDDRVKHALTNGAVPSNLIQMAENGELIREGAGAKALYRVPHRPGPAATDAQKNYEEIRKGITVPRDPDAGHFS